MRRVLAVAVAVVALVGATAAAPVMPSPPAVPVGSVSGELVVETHHREVPDGVLSASFAVSSGCPSGDTVTVVCKVDEPAAGGVEGAALGVSVAHRRSASVPDGLVVERLDVELGEPGDLEVVLTIPPAFAARVVSAVGAEEVSPTGARWSVEGAAAGLHAFPVVLTAPPVGTSELGGVTVTLVRDDVALVASSLAEVVAPVGRLTSVVRMLADSDVDGTAPTFDPLVTDRIRTFDRWHTLSFSAEARSNGLYSGAASGHVRTMVGDVEDDRDYRDRHGFNAATHTTLAPAGGKSTFERIGFDTWWRTSDTVPFEAHDTLTLARVSIPREELPEERFEGPTEVEGSGGTLTLRQLGTTAWSISHGSILSVVDFADEPYDRPGYAGSSVAITGMMFEVAAAGGDIDNSAGSVDLPGETVRVYAPTGWSFDSGFLSWSHRAGIDVDFGEDDVGDYVDLTAVVQAGEVFPMAFEGHTYTNRIPIILTGDKYGQLAEDTGISLKRLVHDAQDTLPGSNARSFTAADR